jgi:hypothetical protein
VEPVDIAGRCTADGRRRNRVVSTGTILSGGGFITAPIQFAIMMSLGQKIVAMSILLLLNLFVFVVFPWYLWVFFGIPSVGVAFHIAKR